MGFKSFKLDTRAHPGGTLTVTSVKGETEVLKKGPPMGTREAGSSLRATHWFMEDSGACAIHPCPHWLVVSSLWRIKLFVESVMR